MTCHCKHKDAKECLRLRSVQEDPGPRVCECETCHKLGTFEEKARELIYDVWHTNSLDVYATIAQALRDVRQEALEEAASLLFDAARQLSGLSLAAANQTQERAFEASIQALTDAADEIRALQEK